MEKIKITSDPDKTITWIWLENEQLKMEYYDFSGLAYYMFGNNIVYSLTVEETERLFLLTKRDETSVLRWLLDNFVNFFGFKRWLEDNRVAFDVRIEKLS
jgi:hypothetical protein